MTRAHLLIVLEAALDSDTRTAREIMRLSTGEVTHRMPRRPWFARSRTAIYRDAGGSIQIIADVAYLATANLLADPTLTAKDAVHVASREVEKSLRRQYEVGNPTATPLDDDTDIVLPATLNPEWGPTDLLFDAVVHAADPETLALVHAIAEGRTPHQAAQALGYRRPRLAYERLHRLRKAVAHAIQ